MENVEIIETTLGELIAALSEEALKICPDEKDASKVVAFALSHLLYNSGAASKTRQIWQ